MTDTEMLFDVQLDFLKRDGTLVEGSDHNIAIPSGTAGTWIFALRFLGEELPQGTVIGLQRYNVHMAYAWQTTDPKRRDYVTVACTGSATLAFESQADRDMKITITEGRLRRGEEIALRLGDRSGGGAGSEVFWTTTRGRFQFTLVAGEESRSAAEDVFLEVLWRDEPKRLRLLGPTVVAPAESFPMNLIVFDINRNVIESFNGTVCLAIPEGVSGLPEQVAFDPEDRGIRIIENVSVATPGVYRIGIALKDGGLASRSNPIVCRESPERRIYWGELHAHGWGDQSMLLLHDRIPKIEPAGRHDQARRVGRYDYGAPGAMAMPDYPQREAIWRTYCDAFDKNDEPGTYLPFMAMEMHPRPGGDWTLVFRDRAELPPSYSTPVAEVFDLYGSREDAILEGHIGGQVPEYEPFHPLRDQIKLIEVVSAFGGAEWLLQQAMRLGYRPAITGASDLHLGLMGAPRAVETFRGRFHRGPHKLNVRDSSFGSGPLGAILSNALTREGLWEGILKRRAYATTGDRIYVHLDAGGHGMGEEADLPDSFDVRLTVHGEADVERIDLIVGDKLAAGTFPGQADVEWAFTFDRKAMPKGKWFYFRVKQVNGEYAWTAPIWFADDRDPGDDAREWPAWNLTEPPERTDSEEMKRYLADLEAYLKTEGDRDKFGEITPVGIITESMGTSASFISTWKAVDYPVSIRWFYEYEIPKIRVDYGYENFGVVDCQNGPQPVESMDGKG